MITAAQAIELIESNRMDVHHFYYPLGSAWKCSAHRNREQIVGEFRFTLAEAVESLVEKLNALPPEQSRRKGCCP